MQTIKIFILHTQIDKKLADSLEDSLHRLISHTPEGNDFSVLRGDKTSTGEISQSLAVSKIYESHVVLLLITYNFIISDYNFELADFIKRLHDNHRIVAIPIIGEICDFNNSNYANLQPLPNQTRFQSITTGNTVAAIKNVAEGIQNVINNLSIPVDENKNVYERATILAELNALISKNRIKQAFIRIDDIIKSSKDNQRLQSELILLQSRYNQAERDARLGIISEENKYITSAQITKSLLAFINDIPEELFYQDIHNIESYLDSKNKVIDYDIGNDRYDEIKEEIITRGTIETKFLNEIKLILIGNGGVGKTTLRKNLVNPDYGITKHDSTVGIEVVPCLAKDTEYGDILMNIWDFGGQGKYRSIQHFFCSHNSFYLFVTQPTELQQDKDDRYGGFHYWLSFINAFGYNKDTGQDSPVIYVMNKADLLPKNIDIQTIQKEFENIKGAINISCKDTESILNLTELIFDYIGETNMIGRTFNKNWLTVKEKLENLNKKYISKSEYQSICEEYGLKEEDQETLLQYLIAVGTILYFPTTLTLMNRIILDPNWVRQIAYEIIDLDCIKRGKLDIEDIFKSGIPDADIALDILVKFELCYKVSTFGKDQYVFPSLFPKIKKHEKIQLGNFQTYPYRYECIFEPFIPASVFHRITVRFNNIIVDNKCWQELIVFNADNVEIIFSENWKANKLSLFFKGESVKIKMQLIRIRAEIEQLCHKILSQKFLKNFQLKEKISTSDGEMTVHQILENKGGVNIGQIIVRKGGGVQIADKIVNSNDAEAQISKFIENT